MYTYIYVENILLSSLTTRTSIIVLLATKNKEIKQISRSANPGLQSPGTTGDVGFKV